MLTPEIAIPFSSHSPVSRPAPDRLVSLAAGYKHSVPIKAAALSPDGRRFAVLDISGTISLISVQNFRLLGKHSESPEFAASTRCIVFDRAGNDVLAFGAPSHSVVVSGHDGKLKYYAEWLTATEEGTAIVRDPDQDGGFLTGDQIGRISGIPVAAIPRGFVFDDQSRVASVAIVGAGSKANNFRRRLVACTSAGEIRFAVPSGDFTSFSIWSPWASENNPATGMILSCDDRTLAVWHADGRLAIWHTDRLLDSDPELALNSPTIEPDYTHVFDGNFETNAKSVVSLDDGRVAVLLLGRTASETIRELKLAVWHPERRHWQTQTIRQVPVSKRDPGTLESIALSRIGNQLYGCVREQTVAYDARSFVFHVPIDGTRNVNRADITGELVGEATNAYLEQSLFEFEGRPALTHFMYDGMALRLTRETVDGWVSSQLGRQGDGLHSTGISVDGRVVAVGLLNRANGDVGQWYAILQSPDPGQADRRIPVEPQCTWGPLLARDDKGRAVVVYSRSANQGTEIVVAPIESGGVALQPIPVALFEDRTTMIMQALTCANKRMAILTATRTPEHTELTVLDNISGEWSRKSLGALSQSEMDGSNRVLIELRPGKLALVTLRRIGTLRCEIQLTACKSTPQ